MTDDAVPERQLEHDWFPRELPGNVVIGARSWLYSSYSFVHCRSQADPAVVIGTDSGIYEGSFFDLGPRGRVVIGDYCTVVGGIFATDATVTVGDYTFIAHEVVFADSDVGRPAPGGSGQAVGVEIGPNAWIGTRATVLSGASIGEGAIVGAFAVVTGEVPPYCIAAGNPAVVVGEVPRS